MDDGWTVVSCPDHARLRRPVGGRLGTRLGGPGLPHTANMLTFLFHLHVRAATECMRPKVILRRLERHRELQRLRVSGELAEAREGRLERTRTRLTVSDEMAEATDTNHFTFTHPSSRSPLVSHDTPSIYSAQNLKSRFLRKLL